MGVAADNRLFLDIGESLDEPLDWAVDQYDLLVITGGGVAEQDRTEPVDMTLAVSGSEAIGRDARGSAAAQTT